MGKWRNVSGESAWFAYRTCVPGNEWWKRPVHRETGVETLPSFMTKLDKVMKFERKKQ